LPKGERNWGSFQKWLGDLLAWANVEEIEAEELLVFPGLEELFSLLQIHRQAATGLYETIIVDCASTGETLRLLSFPETFYWRLEKMFPQKRRILRWARPVVKAVGGGFELPPEGAMAETEELIGQLKQMQQLLLDQNRTSVRLVLTPEKMVTAETRRTYTYLNLFGFNTDAIMVNRVLPPGIQGSYLQDWLPIQAKYMEEIKTSFDPLPIFSIPFMPQEVTGISRLKELADQVFATTNLSDILHQGPTEEVEKDGDEYLLKLSIPLITKEDLALSQRGDELTIQVGWYKRKLILPRKLLGRPTLGARFAHGKLLIRFGPRIMTSEVINP
jgi:arsenite-transporting ATPase